MIGRGLDKNASLFPNAKSLCVRLLVKIVMALLLFFLFKTSRRACRHSLLKFWQESYILIANSQSSRKSFDVNDEKLTKIVSD